MRYNHTGLTVLLFSVFILVTGNAKATAYFRSPECSRNKVSTSSANSHFTGVPVSSRVIDRTVPGFTS